MKTNNSNFPEWHEQPLKLTNQEIENPESVLANFFDSHGLLEVRLRLNEWLVFCIRHNQQDPDNILGLFNKIQQLVEATLVINKSHIKNMERYAENDIIMGNNIDWSQRMLDQFSERPLSCLSELLSAFHYYEYIEIIEQWKDEALSNGSKYEEVKDRKKLINFCKRTPYLIEAMQVIKEQRINQSVDPYLADSETNFSYLDIEEQCEPMNVIRNFFDQFPIRYVRKELWEILSSIVNAEPLTKDASEILYDYEHLECLFEIAYYFLQNENEIILHTTQLEVFHENMKRQQPRIITTENSTFPGWQNCLMHLDIYEIENPEFILRYFFKHKSLSNIRAILKAYIENISKKEAISHEEFSFYNDIEKLIEASWVINERRENDLKEIENNTEEKVHSRFNKQRLYLDDMQEYPLFALCGIFKGYCNDSLKFKIKEWHTVILHNHSKEHYTSSDEKAELILFCEDLQKLIEALYLLCAGSTIDDEYDVLHLNESYLFLNKEEQANPYLALKTFREKFSFQHAQAEIWNMVNAVVSASQSEKLRRIDIIYNFEQFLYMVEAAYILEEDPALLLELKALQDKK